MKIECPNKDIEQKQTSWKKEDPANAEFDSGNDQSKLWKTNEQIGDIFSERVGSTLKDICDEGIVSTNLVEERDKIDSTYKVCENVGTVSPHSDRRKEINDPVVEDLAVELNKKASRVAGSCQSDEFDCAGEDLKNKKKCCKDDSDKSKSNREELRMSTGIVAVQREVLSSVAIGSQKDKVEDTSSLVTFSTDKNKYPSNESSDAQLINNFEDIPLPILLLTYKNHALDEFLLKMVESFGVDNVLRIGGRSREPKLDECNLNNQFRNNTFLASGENTIHLREDLDYVKREIDELQEQIDEIMDLLRSSTQISVISLLRLLDDGQIMRLLQKSKMNKAEQRWLKFIINRLYDEGNSVREFLLYLNQMIDLETEVTRDPAYENFSLSEIWERALNDWLPSISTIRQLRDISRKFANMRKATQHDDRNIKSSEDEEMSDIDEDYLREEQEKRMSEVISFSQYKKRSEIRIMKPSRKTICELSDFPAVRTVDYHFLEESKLDELDEAERITFISSLLKAKVMEIEEQFEATLDDLYLKISEKKYLENQIKLDICKTRKIIGMTITGASVNSELIQQLSPKIVIVEEAAEILEPSLIAALNEKVEHLILIGDHQQLRPKIDTYELRKKFHLDISLMERLIRSGKIDFKTLERQCRMRPEFSIMLRDIYPNLKDSEFIVLNEDHEQHYCINKSMFFWVHDFFEEKTRSYTNKEEAKLVVSLAIYLLRNKVSVHRISVLAPYLGQTKILRMQLDQARKDYPQLIPEMTPQVSTIDRFQGDENDFIIVSLVRSNKCTKKNNIGFMNEMNRRCVTQSRARRGMYFVGNGETYASSSTWLPVISKMKQEGCYGKYIPIQCPKHRDLSVTQVLDAETLNRYIDSPDLICKLPCNEQLSCGIHECQKPCMPFHDHQICTHSVSDKFSDCGHNIIRKCCEELRNLNCQTIIYFSFMCKHLGERKCWEKYDVISKRCEKECEKMMDCSLHRCKKKCGQYHSHLKCKEKVNFIFTLCSHTATKRCYENPESILCKTKVKKKLPCKHTVRIACHKPLPTTCYQEVDYKFPDCSHPSPSKKRCSDEITDVCSLKVKHLCPNCKRESFTKCSFPFICKYSCLRKRRCGHQCVNTCSEDCEKGECQVCEKIEIQNFRKAAMLNMKKIREDLFHKKRAEGLVLKEIDSEVNPGEYDKIKNQLITYFDSKQELLPEILKIEKVDNARLERNFEMVKTRSLGTFVDYMFYECDGSKTDHIAENGFSLQENPKMGIHFLTHFAKTSNKEETRGPKKILLCKVLIGKSLKMDSLAEIDMDQTRIRRFDSVYLSEPNSGKTESCVIFSRNQSFPEYIIHYDCVPIPTLAALPDLKPREGPFNKISVEPSRNQNVSDPKQAHFMKAEAIFYRLQKMYGQKSSTLQIKSVDFVVYSNDFHLKIRFEKKKMELEKVNLTEEILAFHGTDISNVDSILNLNLDPHRSPKHGLLYGKGCYFSEFPDFSQKYGKGLILFRVLPGKEFEDETDDDTWMQKGYHSKKVRANTDRYAEQIIIQDPSQFLPYCIYHFKDN